MLYSKSLNGYDFYREFTLKKRFLLGASLACVVAAGTFTYFNKPAKPEYSTVISFGDSLSDNGNVYENSMQTVPNNPTWFEGRFTNSYVWVEYLCSYSTAECQLIDKANGSAYSHEGTQAVDIGDTSVVDVSTNFLEQVQNFTNSDDSFDPSKTLYTLEVGGNDVVDLKEYDQVGANVDEAIELLTTKKDASNIVVVNIPDVSKAPLYSESTADEREKVHKKIEEVNSQIKGVVNKYKNKGVDIKLVDFNGLLNKLISDKHNISDKACLEIPLEINKLNFVLERPRTEDCQNNLDKYVFFDNLHPTGRVHKLLAQEVSKKL